MKKALVIIFGILLSIIVLGWAFFFLLMQPIYVKNISYEIKETEMKTHITFNTLFIQGKCSTENEEVEIQNQSCIINVPNEESEVTVKTLWNETKIKVDPKVDEVIDFEVEEENFYMAVGERKQLGVSVSKLGNPNILSYFRSQNESVVKVEDDTLIGVGSGETKVTVQVGNIKKEVSVIVTDLYHAPVLEPKKEYLKCNVYSEEQNELLDKVLEYKINKAGYNTRSGVVAALRFLTLEFPYQLNYFFENGRINNNAGGGKVDGEGRYYHKGLYLNSYKFNEIQKFEGYKSWGPVIWGCPLTNWQDEAGFHPGVKYPNGLDCSGFIAWAMYNAGFDVGDTGAGDNTWTDDDLSDIGPHIEITIELLESGTLKAGDIIATDGHMAMIGGLQDGMVYVAESTTYWHGVVMHAYTYDELLESPYLTYTINMDDYYQENGEGEGNYTAYWE